MDNLVNVGSPNSKQTQEVNSAYHINAQNEENTSLGKEFPSDKPTSNAHTRVPFLSTRTGFSFHSSPKIFPRASFQYLTTPTSAAITPTPTPTSSATTLVSTSPKSTLKSPNFTSFNSSTETNATTVSNSDSQQRQKFTFRKPAINFQDRFQALSHVSLRTPVLPSQTIDRENMQAYEPPHQQIILPVSKTLLADLPTQQEVASKLPVISRSKNSTEQASHPPTELTKSLRSVEYDTGPPIEAILSITPPSTSTLQAETAPETTSSEPTSHPPSEPPSEPPSDPLSDPEPPSEPPSELPSELPSPELPSEPPSEHLSETPASPRIAESNHDLPCPLANVLDTNVLENQTFQSSSTPSQSPPPNSLPFPVSSVTAPLLISIESAKYVALSSTELKSHLRTVNFTAPTHNTLPCSLPNTPSPIPLMHNSVKLGMNCKPMVHIQFSATLDKYMNKFNESFAPKHPLERSIISLPTVPLLTWYPAEQENREQQNAQPRSMDICFEVEPIFNPTSENFNVSHEIPQLQRHKQCEPQYEPIHKIRYNLHPELHFTPRKPTQEIMSTDTQSGGTPHNYPLPLQESHKELHIDQFLPEPLQKRPRSDESVEILPQPVKKQRLISPDFVKQLIDDIITITFSKISPRPSQVVLEDFVWFELAMSDLLPPKARTSLSKKIKDKRRHRILHPNAKEKPAKKLKPTTTDFEEMFYEA